MKRENILQKKAFILAINCITICRIISKRDNEYIITKQLIRASTSIGANLEEAIGGFSKNDFNFKLSIVHKEALESRYWIRLLKELNFLDQFQSNNLLNEIEEMLNIIVASIHILKRNNNK